MWQLLMRFTKGIPFYHMWYMYMLIGICFLAPFFVRIAAEIPPKDFEKITCVFTVWASLSSCTSQYLLAWDLGKAALYMGYFMFGHVIYERTRNKKNNFRGVCLIMGGIMIELMMAYISYVHVLNGIAEKDEFYAVILPQSPWIVCASIVIFGGFSLLDIKWDFGKLPACTLYLSVPCRCLGYCPQNNEEVRTARHKRQFSDIAVYYSRIPDFRDFFCRLPVLYTTVAESRLMNSRWTI